MEWYLIKVNDYTDIGRNEEERISVKELTEDTDFDTEYHGGCAYKVWGVHIHPATSDKPLIKHEDETTNSNPTGVQLDEKINQLEKDTNKRIKEIVQILARFRPLECQNREPAGSNPIDVKVMPAGYGLPTKTDIIDIKKRFNKLHGRIQQIEKRMFTKDDAKEADYKHSGTHSQLVVRLSAIVNRLEKLELSRSEPNNNATELIARIKELEDAFEAECDHYDKIAKDTDAHIQTLYEGGSKTSYAVEVNSKEIKSIKQQLSELQQAFVKYTICAKPQDQSIAADPFKKESEDFDTHVKNLHALHDTRDIATRHVKELCKLLPDQKHINTGEYTTLIREIERERSTIDHCNKHLDQLRKERIEPGQILCRNADGTVKPAKMGDIPTHIIIPPSGITEHITKENETKTSTEYKCTECANCCTISHNNPVSSKQPDKYIPAKCPWDGDRVQWKTKSKQHPSGITEQADCSKEENGKEEIRQKLYWYKNRFANLQRLPTKTNFHNREMDHIKTIIEATEKFLNKQSMKYRLVCNNCSPKCVLHFDNYDLPMAVPDCPWNRNTKEWELQCKLSDGLWRKAEWNPEE